MAIKVYLGCDPAAYSEMTYDEADVQRHRWRFCSFSVSTRENRRIWRCSAELVTPCGCRAGAGARFAVTCPVSGTSGSTAEFTNATSRVLLAGPRPASASRWFARRPGMASRP